jgi:hypothetical protein
MKKLFYSIFISLFILLTAEIYAQPQPPQLISPPNNATGVSIFPTFTWSASTGATSYRLQVIQGATTVFDQSNITSPNYTIVTGVLTANTWYYWRVNATGPSGTSTWSVSWNFQTGNNAPPAPALQSPLNNATNIPLMPTLSWNPVTGADFYRIQVSTSNTFTTNVVDVTGINGTGYSVPSGILFNNMTYYWRVDANNNGGASPWSDIWAFSTIPAPPVPPTQLLPANNATNVSVTPTIDWTDSPGAATYHLQVSLNSSFTANVIDDITITSSQYLVPSGILSGTTTYYWRVSGINVAGEGAFTGAWQFTTMLGAPSIPLLIAPPNNSINISLTPTLDWNDVPGATSYRVQVATDPNFTTPVINMVTGSQSQYTVPNGTLNYNVSYYWRVNATNSGGTSAYSTVWKFTTVTSVPAAPTLIAPANNAVGVVLTPLLDWSDVANTDYYRLQISSSATFTTTVLDVSNITTSDFTVPSGVLSGNASYYWRVCGYNTGGQGPYSAAFKFSTMQTLFLGLKVYLEGFYNGTTQVRDTVTLYLANSSSPFAYRDSVKAFLGADGTANSSFGYAPNGNYFIVVKHRNHLVTWSSITPMFQTGQTVNYDFTTASNKAYGNNMKQVGSVWVLYGGDGNADGYVDPSDYAYYKTQFGYDGYKQCDFNGDNFVDGYDLPILYSNFGKSVSRPY